MIPLKRRKLGSSDTGNTGNDRTKFPQVVLFLVERKMGASRRSFLSQLGRRKGFQVEDLFSEKVTHVVSENNSAEEVRTCLDLQGPAVRSAGGRLSTPHLLDVSWYTESMRAGQPVDILDTHALQEQQMKPAEVVVFSVPSYACQRRTTVVDPNSALTEALSLLAENAELSDDDGRGVAFRRAAAVLKALPAPVTSAAQLRGLPCLGEHSLRVIRDVLETGASSEVRSTRESRRFRALKVLTGVFGVGAKTADRWIRGGIHDLQQLRDSGQMLNRAQQAGLEHYDDINQLVTKAEADAIRAVVEEAVTSVLPGAQTVLTGGFRRGKMTGHDVDFLITHPEEGREVGLMPKLVSWLESRGLLLYQKTTGNSYLESKDGPGRPSSNMDRFERCFAIFKLAKTGEPGAGGPQEGEPEEKNLSNEKRERTKPATRRLWRALRVDLVVSPVSQFAFALLGWTGSKLFERELRRWAGYERGMSLSSHALYDNTQKTYLRAASEEEIFAHLGLEFIPPSERNA
ncbi:DNA-directed DNA/RNA polymerase mu isoform X2 [Cololabis saira]|uniref:DNA-directed DNA/RNA polymerase mu isoform X2 n=1 Tax=Cololabis saira TaxID=129043 RepID=UPI002AD4BBFE|nr:DNA-directed DNA/RNA polymerase mu isoform X2 [Cololabis saira]